MAQSPSPSQPLDVGGIVSISFNLYKTKFKDYVTIATHATVWVLAPLLVSAAVGVLYVLLRPPAGLLALLIPALIVWFVYASAKYTANSALISRLAYGELNQQPESVKDARRHTHSRMWSIWWTVILTSLIFMAIALPLYMLMVIPLVAFSIGIGSLGDPGARVTNFLPLIMLFLFVLFPLVLVAFTWLGSRLVGTELPLAIESGLTPTQSIGRIWQLTKGNAWRILLVLFITTLVTLPIQVFAQLGQTLAELAARATGADSATVSIMSLIGSLILSYGLGILVMPLWQITKSVIYRDLQVRREGLGLGLQDR